LHQAHIDVGSGEIENYRVSSVTYFQEERLLLGGTVFYLPSALMRVGVVAGSVPEQVTNEQGTSADLGFLKNRQIVAFNLNNAEKAQYVFPAEASEPDNWQYRLTSLDAGASTPVEDFGAGFNVQ